ncbi:hypothetical protein ACSBR2_027592 [Camellia fascicularis]
MTIPISSVDQEDSVVWHHTKNGNFEVGHQNGASTSVRLPDKFWKLLWSLPVPPKVRNFWWKVCNKKLATKENLFRHKCASSQCCPICVRLDLCGLGVNSASCQGMILFYLLQVGLSPFESCTNDWDRKERLGKAAIVGWCIWKEDYSGCDPEGLARLLDSQMSNWKVTVNQSLTYVSQNWFLLGSVLLSYMIFGQ